MTLRKPLLVLYPPNNARKVFSLLSCSRYIYIYISPRHCIRPSRRSLIPLSLLSPFLPFFSLSPVQRLAYIFSFPPLPRISDVAPYFPPLPLEISVKTIRTFERTTRKLHYPATLFINFNNVESATSAEATHTRCRARQLFGCTRIACSRPRDGPWKHRVHGIRFRALSRPVSQTCTGTVSRVVMVMVVEQRDAVDRKATSLSLARRSMTVTFTLYR